MSIALKRIIHYENDTSTSVGVTLNAIRNQFLALRHG